MRDDARATRIVPKTEIKIAIAEKIAEAVEASILISPMRTRCVAAGATLG
jgi:hypothetical protein